jgi:hypothetical protein
VSRPQPLRCSASTFHEQLGGWTVQSTKLLHPPFASCAHQLRSRQCHHTGYSFDGFCIVTLAGNAGADGCEFVDDGVSSLSSGAAKNIRRQLVLRSPSSGTRSNYGSAINAQPQWAGSTSFSSIELGFLGTTFPVHRPSCTPSLHLPLSELLSRSLALLLPSDGLSTSAEITCSCGSKRAAVSRESYDRKCPRHPLNTLLQPWWCSNAPSSPVGSLLLAQLVLEL